MSVLLQLFRFIIDTGIPIKTNVFVRQQTNDGRLCVLVCDIFDLDGNPTVLSEADKVDCVFDRAAFVAIRPEDRDRYVSLMRSLSADFNYLLIVEQYDDQNPTDLNVRYVWSMAGSPGYRWYQKAYGIDVITDWAIFSMHCGF